MKCKQCGKHKEAWWVVRPKGKDEATELRSVCLNCINRN